MAREDVKRSYVLNKEILNSDICDNVDKLRSIMLNEISKTERQILPDITFMWDLKIRVQTHRNSRMVVSRA